MAYATAQTFGWNWGEDLEPAKDARFSLVYTGAIFLSALVNTDAENAFEWSGRL